MSTPRQPKGTASFPRWAWYLLGAVILIALGISALNRHTPTKTASAITPTRVTSSTPVGQPSRSASPTTSTATVAASVPAPAPTTPQTDHASALASARTACHVFQSSVLPPILANVQAENLAPLIRLQLGEPLNGGPVDINAPWFTMNNAAGEATNDDPSFQPLADAMSALDQAIIHADPGGDLSEIDNAAADVTKSCTHMPTA